MLNHTTSLEAKTMEVIMVLEHQDMYQQNLFHRKKIV